MYSAYHPHDRVTLDASKDGRTKQSFANESNINIIMKKYEKTGLIDHLNQFEGKYGDFIAYQDYHSSMNLIREAGEAFMTIPATVRAKFENDPAKFLEFAQNPENHDELVEMGLARPIPSASDPTPETETPPEDPPTPPEAITAATAAPAPS